jgi:hypothetical protein
MQERRRFKHIQTLEERLLAFAEDGKAQPSSLPPGPARDLAAWRARQVDTAAHISDWLNSPGLKAPR